MNSQSYDPRQSAQRPTSYSQNNGINYPKRYVPMPTGLPRGNNSIQQQQYHQQDDTSQGGGGYPEGGWDDSGVVGGGGGGGGGGHQHHHHHHGGSSHSQNVGMEKPTGLRHFSTKVCEKVKEKGLTNYNEVADELVADYFQNNLMKQVDVVKQEYDMKNIRRRVYDALNVLLAMNIITKNKKDIRWIGLPASASQEITRLEEEKTRRELSIQTKKEALQQMIMQIVSYKSLIARNRKFEHTNGRPDPDTLLHLPFLIINTDKDTNVECSVSADKSEFLFSFDKKFEIHDDFEVLKKLNLTCGLDTGKCTEEDIKKAKGYLPSLHQHYIDEIIETKKRQEVEKAESKKRLIEQQRKINDQMIQQQQQQIEATNPMAQSLYYDDEANVQQPLTNPGGRFNRQLQEHLMLDGSEDRNATAGILEDEMMEKSTMGSVGSQIQRGSMYSYSPPKVRPQGGMAAAPIQPPATTRRYYVQKGAQGQVKREMSPTIRQMSRPYPQQSQRLIPGSGGGPMKYYVPGQGGGGASGLHAAGQGGPRYIQRVRPQPPLHQSQQQTPLPPPPSQPSRVVYTNSSGQPIQLAPGQRIVTQRIVTPGSQPGTVVRKVIRKIVVNSGGGPSSIQKQSPAQQVIQKRMMEQEMKPDHQNQPMTSAQAAAMIQHPPVEEFNYFQ